MIVLSAGEMKKRELEEMQESLSLDALSRLIFLPLIQLAPRDIIEKRCKVQISCMIVFTAKRL